MKLLRYLKSILAAWLPQRRRPKERGLKIEDVIVAPQRAVVSLRERVLKIEISLKDIVRFFARHERRLKIGAVALILLVGFFGYLASLRATVVRFYPSSCLGNWEGVANALGRPDLEPETNTEVFDLENSARFAGGAADVFCGNFKPEGMAQEELDTKTVQSARLQLSWVKKSVIGTDESASTTTTESPFVPSSSISSSDPLIDRPAETSSDKEAPIQESQPKEPLPPPASEEGATVPEGAPSSTDVQPVSLWLLSPILAHAQEATAPEIEGSPPVTEPAPPTVAEDPPPFQAEPPPETPTEAPAQVSDQPQAPPEEPLPPEPSPGAGPTTSTEPLPEEATTTPDVVPEQRDFSPSSTLVVPVPSELGQTATSAEESAFLEVRFSINGDQWQTLTKINAADPLPAEIELPIGSWNEIKQLQIGVRGRSEADDQEIFLDGFSLDVVYEDAASDILDGDAEINESVLKTNVFSPAEQPRFRFRYRSQRNPLLQLVSSFTGLGKYKVKKVEIVGSHGEIVDITESVRYQENEEWSLEVTERPKEIRPGRYLLRIEVDEGGQSYFDEKEFFWGVLAINVNKATLPLGETARLEMGALTDSGKTICDANLRLTVVDPFGQPEDVRVNPSGKCQGDNVVDVADYSSEFKPAIPGTHRMILARLNETGGIIHEIEDSFEVREVDLPVLDVERIGPTRIYPFAPYLMKIRVTARAAFRGTITETVPQDFIITERDRGSIITYPDRQTKTWQVDLRAGETRELEYQFDAPDISPYLFLVGPLAAEGEQVSQIVIQPPSKAVTNLPEKLVGFKRVRDFLNQPPPPPEIRNQTSSVSFLEARSWQIASDAAVANVQRGSQTMGTTPATVTITAVDPTKTFVVCDSRTNTSNASNRVSCYLNSSTSLIIESGAANASLVANWQVAEFASGLSVQRGKFLISTTSSANTVSINPVATSTSFIIVTDHTSTTAQNLDELWTLRARFTTSSTIELFRNQTSTESTVAAWEVITFTDGTGSVQHGELTMSGVTSATSSISSVNTAKSFVVMSKAALAAVNGVEGQYQISTQLSSSSTVNFQKAVATNGADIAFQVVTMSNNTTVQAGTATTSAVGDTTLNRTLSPGLAISQSVSFITPRMTGTGGTAANLDESSWTSTFTTSTNIQIQRGGTGTQGAITYFAVQFDNVVTGLTQSNYHFRQDNGTEANASSATSGVENTGLTNFRVGSSTRIRLEAYNSGVVTTTPTLRLEYAIATSGPWYAVGLSPTSSEAIALYDSPNLTDGSSTTNIATSTGGVTDSDLVFLTPNYGVKDTSNAITSSTYTSSTFSEVEFAIQPTAGVAASTYYLRLSDDGTALASYNRYPSMSFVSNLRHIHYRWFNDDGSESSSTVAAGEDSIVTNIDKLSTRRLRFEISNYGAPAGNQLYRLEVSGANPSSCASAAYTRVSSSTNWRMATSTYFNDGDPTTNRPEITDANTTFVAGQIKSTSDQASALSLTGNQFTEIEYSVQATASSTNGATYCFRLTNGGSTSSISYLVYAQASIIQGTDATVSSFGNQTSKMDVPSTDQYVGGGFAITETSASSRNITSITISEKGTVDGADLSNIKLYYEYDTSAPLSCASESYGGTEAQYGSTDTNGFSSANGTSTFTGTATISSTSTLCLYVVFDVLSGANHSSTVEIEISNPANDVQASSGNIGPGTIVAIPGTTYLSVPPALTQIHYRWRNDDGPEIGVDGSGHDGAVSLTTVGNLNTQILGSLRSGAADGISTAISAFASSTGGRAITVASTTGFGAGDEVMLINFQGTSSTNSNAGKYEFLRVASINPASNTLIFATDIQQLYGATSSNLALTGQSVVAQRVPQWTTVNLYSTGTLTADPWDGGTGGVLAFRSRSGITLASNSFISMTGSGYRGGVGGVSLAGGQNGESYDGFVGSGGAPATAGTNAGGAGTNNGSNSQGTRGGGGGGGGENTTDNTNAGGGGAGAGHGGGGGGGGGTGDGTSSSGSGGAGGNTGVGGGGGGCAPGNSNGTNGGAAGSAAANSGSGGGVCTGGAAGSGSTTGQGGSSAGADPDSGGGGGGGGGLYGTSTLTSLFAGSGGGGGGDSNEATSDGRDGGNGGGIIFIGTSGLNNNGAIRSNGEDGLIGGADANPFGSSGAGAGGSILIKGVYINNSGTIAAAGGASTLSGGSGPSGGGGGGGGVGRLRLEAGLLNSTGTTPTASTSSLSESAGGTFSLAEDTPLTKVVIGTTYRLRLEVISSGGESTSTAFRIEYATATSGPWTAVPTTATSEAWEMATSSYITDGERTYNINPGLTDAGAPFVPGELKDANNQTNGISLENTEFTEMEFSMRATANALGQGTFYFRVTRSGSTANTSYAVYGQASLNSTPQIFDFKLNGSSSIALTEGTSTLISATATSTDLDGYTDLLYATSTIYRSGVTSTYACAADNNNCYRISSSSCAFSSCSGNRCTLTCSANIWFFAEPTDVGTFALENWLSTITLADRQGAALTTTTSPGVDLLTLLGLSVTPQINYGTLAVNTDTGATNQTTTVRNTGNAQIDLLLSGTAMTYASSSIAAGNQRYASSSFTFSSCTICQILSGTSTIFQINLAKAMDYLSVPTTTVFWGLNVPIGSAGGPHQGRNTFLATPDI